MPRLAMFLLCGFAALGPARAADWPTYRNDAGRSGYTPEELPPALSLAWSYQTDAPQPAWPRDDRMLFDRANEVVVAGGRVFFGSSADCRVVALDAQSGRQLWAFFTGAPIRFAPAVWKDRVFVASDDGYLYCLAAADGQLLNRWRGGPSDELILGNGRMISRWPARGGPAILNDIVYFAAGVWQSDGVFLIAIDARSGDVLWRNDDAGKIYMAQPHGGAMSESGVSAQGYLVATDEHLLMPTGRAVPAGFAREGGRFLYYHLQANGRAGGTQTVVDGTGFYNGGIRFNVAAGVLEAKLGVGPIAVVPGGIVQATKGGVQALAVVRKKVPDRKGEPTPSVVHETLWSAPDVDGSANLIVAGNTIVAGGAQKVATLDRTTHAAKWSTDVDGLAYGLAVSDGRLLVSTDRGTIYCFGGGKHATPSVVKSRMEPANNNTKDDDRYTAAASEIVRRTGIRDGYCLDLDCGDGRLAIALARATNLKIYALASTSGQLAEVRNRVLAAGLYGLRVTVHQADAEHAPYGKYFADLVVSSRSLDAGPLEITADKLPATLRPFGGQACSGKVGAMQTFTRGALAKTGSWTHQYSDPGNTSCSTDEIVKGELHALWFRDVDLEMPQRHGRGHAPLFQDGRMFVEGIGALRAVDAYNGRNLWEFSLPDVQKDYSQDHLNGTAVTGSNFCVAGGSVYVHDKRVCNRLDAVTGRKLGEFAPPAYADGKPGQWGYIACDGQRLYGSLPNPAHIVHFAYGGSRMGELWSESKTVFALDAQSGKLLWRYDAENSVRHNAIALGAGKLFLIDRAIAAEDIFDKVNRARKVLPKTVAQPPGKLVALDATTGKPAWKADREAFGTMLVFSAPHDALLMGYQSTRFRLPSEVGGQLAVFRGSTGKPLWEKAATYITRPLLNDRTVYAQGGAWDLLTGEDQPFTFKRSYGCGQLAGSRNMLLFRSGTLGYLDLTRGSGVENFGGIRPGCWINALPVGGLVLVPDASAGCQCSYQNRSWMALSGAAE